MNGDKKILQSLARGDRHAFTAVVDKYKSLVCSVGYCFVGDFADSELVGKRVFLWLLENSPQSDKNTSLNALLVEKTREFAQNAEGLGSEGIDLDVISFTPLKDEDLPEQPTDRQNEEVLQKFFSNIDNETKEIFAVYCRNRRDEKTVAALLGYDTDFVGQRLEYCRSMMSERQFLRAEAALRHSEPDERFVASVMVSVPKISDYSSKQPPSGNRQLLYNYYRRVVFSILVGIVAVIIAATFLVKDKSQAGQTEIAPSDIAALQPINLPETQPRQEPQEVVVNEDIFTDNAVLSGIITDIKTGEPVIDAIVMLELPDGKFVEIQTDADGKYSFGSLPAYGQCNLYLLTNEYVGINYGSSDTVGLVLDELEPKVRDFQLEQACMLEVFVYDQAGEPIKDAVVVVSDTSNENPAVVNMNNITTDSNGRLIIGGIKPTDIEYSVTVWRLASESDDGSKNYLPYTENITLSDADTLESLSITLLEVDSLFGQSSEE